MRLARHLLGLQGGPNDPLAAMPHFPDDNIGEILRKLHEMGDSLENPRPIDYDCVFPSPVLAEQFLEAVRWLGYERVTSMHWEKLGSWCVCVTVFMLPEHEPMSLISGKLAAVSSEFMGNFDGCGCFIDNRG